MLYMLIKRYQQMVEELFCTLKEGVNMGSLLEQIVPSEDEPSLRKKTTTLTTKKTRKI